jgi:cytochrome b561
MLTDTRNGYGAIAICLHWAGAIAMLYLWLTGPDDHGGPASASTASHIAIGSGLAILLLARVAWRLASVNPAPLSQNAVLNTVASIVKMLLLVDLLVIIGTGFLSVWFKGDPISLFGVVALPNLVGVHADWAFPMHIAHSISTNLVFTVLLGLHVLGALKHVLVDRDGTFMRMVWPRGESV